MRARRLTRLRPRPAAVVRFVPERFDDLMWENDRAAHRIYGPALQAQEPPSGSGVDVWAKRVRWPFMDRLLASGRRVIASPPDAWGGRAAADWARRVAAGETFDPLVERLIPVSRVLDRIYGR